MTKDVICKSIISYNSFKLLLNAIILKNREEDRELVSRAPDS